MSFVFLSYWRISANLTSQKNMMQENVMVSYEIIRRRLYKDVLKRWLRMSLRRCICKLPPSQHRIINVYQMSFEVVYNLSQNRCLADVIESCLQVILEQMSSRCHRKLSTTYLRIDIQQMSSKVVYKLSWNRYLPDVFSSCLQVIVEQMSSRHYPKLSTS